LRSIRSLVEQLNSTPEGRELLPPDFMELWAIFDSMLDEVAA
jgi:hypothetical protein